VILQSCDLFLVESNLKSNFKYLTYNDFKSDQITTDHDFKIMESNHLII